MVSLSSVLLGSLATATVSAVAVTCWRNTTCSTITEAAFPGHWDDLIYAPESRSVAPQSVLARNGERLSSWDDSATLASNGSQLVFDFGKEVGGIVHLHYTVTGSSGAVGLAFSEAKNWIGEWSDNSNGKHVGPDGAIYSNFTGPGAVHYTMPLRKLRGGFRYLTLFLVSDAASVTLDSIELEIGFQPTWSNLRAYQGYFYSSDSLLNRIWYAGAYTLQTNAVPVASGRRVPFDRTGWNNDGALGPGETIIVDGAKRDRAVWTGDLGVAVPAMFVSLGELDSVRNALQVIYDNQNGAGAFPEAGPPLLQRRSDTYHMWTMIGTYNYVLYTNDTAFLARNWPGYLRAMNFICGKVLEPSGLLNVSDTHDWARWQVGFNMSAAQMLLYRTLTTGAELAAWRGADDGAATSALWAARAARLQAATVAHCFDGAYGAFRDNATATALHPQDANALAVLFGVVAAGGAAAQRISAALTANWTPRGAASPELPGDVSPFVGSLEVLAHLRAGQTARALALVRAGWGWYLDHPNGTQSTLIEGYCTDGSFGYRRERGYAGDASYVSHAHGWSAGPTSALTEFVLGLAVTDRAGSAWRFAPQYGDLAFAEGGFCTSLGRFSAQWTAPRGEGASASAWASVSTPVGTVGTLTLPVLVNGVKPRVFVDGKEVEAAWARNDGIVFDTVVVSGVAGGNHTLVVV